MKAKKKLGSVNNPLKMVNELYYTYERERDKQRRKKNREIEKEWGEKKRKTRKFGKIQEIQAH